MSNDTNIPTPRTAKVAAEALKHGLNYHEGFSQMLRHARQLERELAQAQTELGQFYALQFDPDLCHEGYIDLFRNALRALADIQSVQADLAAARKDSERLKWLFSGYAVCRWENGEVSMPDSDKIMYSVFDLDDDMKAAMEGGER